MGVFAGHLQSLPTLMKTLRSCRVDSKIQAREIRVIREVGGQHLTFNERSTLLKTPTLRSTRSASESLATKTACSKATCSSCDQCRALKNVQDSSHHGTSCDQNRPATPDWTTPALLGSEVSDDVIGTSCDQNRPATPDWSVADADVAFDLAGFFGGEVFPQPQGVVDFFGGVL